jgi:putative excisionase
MSEIEMLREQLDRIEVGLLGQKKVLNFSEACSYVGVSKSQMYKMTSNKEIPHSKPRAKMIYFNREELDEWLLQNRVSTADEVQSEALAYVMSHRK